jgi:hypothetical protein
LKELDKKKRKEFYTEALRRRKGITQRRRVNRAARRKSKRRARKRLRVDPSRLRASS